jgi:hypothetical protein
MQSVPLFGFDGCFVELLERCKMRVAIKGNWFQGKHFYSYFMCVCYYILCSRTLLFNRILILMGAVPMCLGTIRIRQYLSNTTVLFIIVFCVMLNVGDV